MIWLLCLIAPPVLWMLGRGLWLVIEQGTNGKQNTFTDSIVTGLILVIGLAEAIHLATVILHVPLVSASLLFLIGIAAGLVLSLMVFVIRRKSLGRPGRISLKLDGVAWFVLILFVLLVLGQAAFILFSGKVYWDRDLTVETVNTFLIDGGVHLSDPMTGEAYALGMPFRVKILCLPTLYAILCRLFSLSATAVVWKAVPLIILFVSYCAFHALASALFEDNALKRMGFLACCALLLWVGAYLYGMEGFGLLFGAFRGTSIRALVLFPYALSLILRKKWLPLFLCFLAEACIVWTLYGMGLCFLAAAGMAVTFVIVGRLNARAEVSRGRGNAGKGAR